MVGENKPVVSQGMHDALRMHLDEALALLPALRRQAKRKLFFAPFVFEVTLGATFVSWLLPFAPGLFFVYYFSIGGAKAAGLILGGGALMLSLWWWLVSLIYVRWGLPESREAEAFRLKLIDVDNIFAHHRQELAEELHWKGGDPFETENLRELASILAQTKASHVKQG